jgi:hypothetical protein
MSTPGMSAKVTITQAQAACLFYGKDVTAQNEVECEKRIDEIKDVELCFLNNDPTVPFLVASQRINFFPICYQRYQRTASNNDDVASISTESTEQHKQIR